MPFGLIETVLDLFLPLFEHPQQARERILIEQEKQDPEGENLPEDQRREEV
jgi:hypothetical protein